LIVAVHRALASLGLGGPEEEAPQPAVPIRRSVQRDYVVCLELGFAPRRCAAICGCSTGSRSLRIVPAGIYRRSPGDGTGLFGATLGYREADRARPPTGPGRAAAPT
jgi:hypothetical protein